MLFNIYIDDLVRGLSLFSSRVCAYADDIAIVCRGLETLKSAIKFTRTWCARNKIDLNDSKSGILKLKKRAHKSTVQNNILNIPIVNTYKYLGMEMSESLKLSCRTAVLKKNL